MPSSGSLPLRPVLDTNVVVAGLLWSGPPRRLLEAAVAGEVELHSSAVLLDELAHALGYSKFSARIESFGTSIAALVAQYTALVSLAAPASVPRVVAGDADDDHVIAAAVAARRADRHRGSQASAAHRHASGHRHRHRARGVVDQLDARTKT